MRKILIAILSTFILLLISCAKIPKQESVANIDLTIASKLQEIDKNYSDETLKALSVILRNNTLINKDKQSKNIANEKYYNIAKMTHGKTLKTKNNDIIEISFNSNDDYTWQKNIKKNQILEFALENNVTLTNISNIKEVTENERVIGVKIGNKYFDYNLLANKFNLESNKITGIYSNKNEIIINGKGKDFYNHFDTEKAESLSNNNYNYLEILTHFFNDLTLN